MATAKQTQARLVEVVADKFQRYLEHRLEQGKHVPLEALLTVMDKVLEAAEAREKTAGLPAAVNLYKVAGIIAADAAQYLHVKAGSEIKDEEATHDPSRVAWGSPPWLTQYLEMQERVLREQEASRMSRALPSSHSTPGVNGGHSS